MDTQKLEVAALPQSSGVLAVIDRAARDNNVDVEKMERLLALAEQIHAREAKAAFDQAMNAAQGEMRPISRDCHNPQTRSRYASYEAIDTAIRPIYSAHGFAMLFGSKASPNPGSIIVTCRVSHRAGHAENVELEMPADGKGAKGGDVQTKTHATGSALSYAKRYIANLVWNLSFGESDDDGNAAGKRPPTREPQSAPKSAPQVNPERKTATAADILPKVATETTRKWMLEELQKIFNPEDVWGYATRHGFIKESETLDKWPLEAVPTSKQGISELAAKIGQFIGPSEPPTEDDDMPPEIANAIISVPRAGMKRAEYLQQPDTVGSLYSAAKSGEEWASRRLFGLANNFTPESYSGKISKDDEDCRAALDAFLAWRDAKEGE